MRFMNGCLLLLAAVSVVGCGSKSGGSGGGGSSPVTPTITWAKPAAIPYGTALSAVQLNASSGGVAGTFTYVPAVGAVLTAGTQTLSVTFAPTDTTRSEEHTS